jgi:hypothetical protein
MSSRILPKNKDNGRQQQCQGFDSNQADNVK